MKGWGQRKTEVTEKVSVVTLPNMEALARSHCEREVQAISAISAGLQIVELEWQKSSFQIDSFLPLKYWGHLVREEIW